MPGFSFFSSVSYIFLFLFRPLVYVPKRGNAEKRNFSGSGQWELTRWILECPQIRATAPCEETRVQNHIYHCVIMTKPRNLFEFCVLICQMASL